MISDKVDLRVVKLQAILRLGPEVPYGTRIDRAQELKFRPVQMVATVGPFFGGNPNESSM